MLALYHAKMGRRMEVPMSDTARATTTEVPVPEPDLTATEIVRRAAALKPLAREQQDESERRGCYSEQLHEAFLRAGFYRMVLPRRFGRNCFDLPACFA